MTPSNSLDQHALAERIELRRQLRASRAALSPIERHSAERAILRYVATSRWLHGQRPLGLYASVGFEVATGVLLQLARSRRCPVYLPRIVNYRQHRMVFAPASSAAAIRNRYGIAEPAAGSSIPVRALSVVFLPLLGVDQRGTRLGSGAGYYDRLFAFRRNHNEWRRPLLVGIAYRCQLLTHIPAGTLDVPLDALVNEEGVTYFSS